MATPQSTQPTVPNPPNLFSAAAIDILRKLQTFGFQVLADGVKLPSDQQYGLIVPGFERGSLMSTALAAERSRKGPEPKVL